MANTAIGILQDVRAKRALDRLALLVAPHARAVRDGAETSVPAGEVVDGDLVALRPGDQVIADGSVVESSALMLDESQLTGESQPIGKGVGEEILSGSFCVEGAGRYIASSTGEASYASQVVGEAREFRYRRSPLENQINRLLLVTVAVMVPLGAAFVFVLISHDAPFRSASATATAGIVTLVPEGLVLLTSLTFAVAAVRLSGRGMLVQAFNAVESLANVDTVCLDKTGTLTDGTLALHGVYPGRNGSRRRRRAAGGRVRGEHHLAQRHGRRDRGGAARDGPPGHVRGAVLVALEVERLPARGRRRDARPRRAGRAARRRRTRRSWPSTRRPAGARSCSAHHARPTWRRPDDGAAPPAIEPIGRDRARGARAAGGGATRSRSCATQGVAVKVMSGDSPATVAAVAERAGINVEGPAIDGAHCPEGAGPGRGRDRVDRVRPPLAPAQARC